MIVKVQMALATSDGEKRVLIYNRSRTVMYEPSGKEAVEVINRFGLTKEMHKVYVWAEVVGGELVLGDVVKKQTF